MGAARGFGGLILVVAARANGGAVSSGRGEVASKPRRGAARCRHPVFMTESGLGHKARREAWVARTPSDGHVRRGNEHEVEDNVADKWGWAVSVTKRGRRERRGRAARPLRRSRGRAGEAKPTPGPTG